MGRQNGGLVMGEGGVGSLDEWGSRAESSGEQCREEATRG